jgi:hypothetical protein
MFFLPKNTRTEDPAAEGADAEDGDGILVFAH